MKIDASGQEAQLDELKSRWYAYQQERWFALSETNKHLHPAVYTNDKNQDDDPHRFFIFTNEATLKHIRWTHFLSDSEPITRNFSAVEELLEKEIARAASWLTENNRDIQENFDPTVVKLRKKRKIIMSEQALDDLSKIDEDD